MKINLKQIFGNKVEMIIIEAEPSDTIENLLGIIEKKTQIPLTEQRLFFGGKVLECNRTLSDYNITDDSTILLRLKNVGNYCFIKYGDKKYRISGFTSVGCDTLYLKKRVSEKTGIEPSKIELIADGIIMEDSKILDDYNIHGKEIEFKVKK